MTAGRQGKTTNRADDVIGTKILHNRHTQWGEMPGEIVAFDAATQTATVQPLYRPRFNGVPVSMPQLLEVPVRFDRAGDGALTYPVKAGDRVTLRPQMRSTENYHTEDDGAPSDARSFNLSDCEAFVNGGESMTDPIAAFDPANTHLRFSPDGAFGIRGNVAGIETQSGTIITVEAVEQILLLAPLISLIGSQGSFFGLIATALELLADDGLQVNYGSSAGTDHALQHQAQYAEIAAKLRAMEVPQ